MIREAIVLAGGLGTRLRLEVPDLPKCLAPVAGVPFLDYLLKKCRQQGVQKFVFALGHQRALVEEYLAGTLSPDDYRVSVENAPLGTGGAIRLACASCTDQQIFVFNADSFFGIPLDDLAGFHEVHAADCSLALKPMQNFNRYGVVETDETGRIIRFQEKRETVSGLINGGVYALDKNRFESLDFPTAFSFEKDYLQAYLTKQQLFGMASEEYFIDIGVPEDYRRAQIQLPNQL